MVPATDSSFTLPTWGRVTRREMARKWDPFPPGNQEKREPAQPPKRAREGPMGAGIVMQVRGRKPIQTVLSVSRFSVASMRYSLGLRSPWIRIRPWYHKNLSTTPSLPQTHYPPWVLYRQLAISEMACLAKCSCFGVVEAVLEHWDICCKQSWEVTLALPGLDERVPYQACDAAVRKRLRAP